MARNSKNWSKVTINYVEFSKRPTKIGKGATAKLVGYAQVPMLPDEMSEEDAQTMLTDWLESGVLGYKQTLIATINALAVQVQAEVRRKYDNAMNGKHTEDQLFNIGFSKWAKDDRPAFNAAFASLSADEFRQKCVEHARKALAVGSFDAEQNVVTSSNTMSLDDNVQEQ